MRADGGVIETMSEAGLSIFKALFRAAPDAAAVLDENGVITAVNPAFERDLAIEASAAVGHALSSFYARPADAAGSAWARGGTAAGAPDAARLVRADNTAFEARIFTVRDEESGLVAAVIRTAEEERTRTLARQAAKARVADAFARPRDGAFSFDLRTGDGLVSGCLTDLLDTGPEGAATRADWFRALHRDDRAAVQAALDALEAEGRGASSVACRVSPYEGETRWLRLEMHVAARGEDARATRVTGVARDITKERALEGRLAALQDRLDSAISGARLEAWEYDFSADEGAFDPEAWRARLHPDDAEHAYAAFMGLQFGGRFDEIYRYRDADRGWVRRRSFGRRLADDPVRPGVRAAGFGYDLADPTHAPNAASRDVMLREAVDAAGLSAWSYDFKARELTLTGAVVRTLGLGDHEAVLPIADWRARLHPGEEGEMDAATVGLATGEAVEAVYRIQAEDGAYCWLQLRGRAHLQDADGAPLRAAGFITDVTESRRMAAALEESRELIDRAAQAGDLAFWEMDLVEGRNTSTGALVTRLHGLPEGRLMRGVEDWVEHVHPDDRALIDEARARYLASGDQPSTTVFRVWAPALNEWRTMRSTGRVVRRDVDGAPLRAVGMSIDVTEAERLKAELETRERDLADAIHAGVVGIWIYDHKSDRQRVSGEVLNWFDRTAEDPEVSPEEWRAIVHPEDRGLTREAHLRIGRGETYPAFEYRMRAPDGWRWVRAQGRPTKFDEDGSALRSAGVIVDISSERRLAEALREESGRLDAIYRQTPAMMHSIDMTGAIVQVSDYWLKHMGYGREEVIGRRSTEFLTKESARRAAEEVLPAFWRDGVCNDVHYEMVRKDGSRIDVLLSARLERDAVGEPLKSHAILVDVTDKLAAERALQSHAAELERTNRELDRFAAVASHDLQEPLRKISAFASLVRRRYADQLDPEGEHSLDYLVDAAGRMRRLIEDLLAYARTSSREMERAPIDLSAMTAEVLEALDLPIEECEADVQVGDLPTVEGDPALMRLLMQNLISNALKYRKGDSPRVEVSAEPDGDLWRVTVADDGIGLDEAFAEKIFAPFQRLHGREDYEGTGIGLAICQQVVERHGGRIWVESAPGEGARFHFTVPAGGAAGREAA